MANVFVFKSDSQWDDHILIVAANSKYEAAGFIQTVSDENGDRKYWYDISNCRQVSGISYTGKDVPKIIDVYDMFKPKEENADSNR